MMIFMSFNSNMTDVTSAAGTTYCFRAPKFTPAF